MTEEAQPDSKSMAGGDTDIVCDFRPYSRLQSPSSASHPASTFISAGGGINATAAQKIRTVPQFSPS